MGVCVTIFPVFASRITTTTQVCIAKYWRERRIPGSLRLTVAHMKLRILQFCGSAEITGRVSLSGRFQCVCPRLGTVGMVRSPRNSQINWGMAVDDKNLQIVKAGSGTGLLPYQPICCWESTESWPEYSNRRTRSNVCSIVEPAKLCNQTELKPFASTDRAFAGIVLDVFPADFDPQLLGFEFAFVVKFTKVDECLPLILFRCRFSSPSSGRPKDWSTRLCRCYLAFCILLSFRCPTVSSGHFLPVQGQCLSIPSFCV